MVSFNKKVFFVFIFLLILVFSVNTKVFAVDLNGYDDLDDDQAQTTQTTTQTPAQTTPTQTTKATETDKSKNVKTVEQDKATQSHPQTGIFMNTVYVSTGVIMLVVITTAYIKFKKYNF